MALFQRQPSYNESKPIFSIGLNKTLIIVGLGNVGKDYDNTRHNIGFEAVDALVKSKDELSDWQDKKNFKAHISSGQFGDTRIIVVKPTTLMNLSGDAVAAVQSFYKLSPKQILVVHDELDINFGQIRTQVGGSSAGHNGVQSIIDHIGDTFSRLRIGIGPKTSEKMDSADFVLGKFSKDQLDNVEDLKKETTAMMIEYIYSGQINKETRTFLI